MGIPSTPKPQSPVAQLVEQVAVNHLVTGSSPVGGAFSLLRKETPQHLTPGVEISAAGRFSFLLWAGEPFGALNPEFAAIWVL